MRLAPAVSAAAHSYPLSQFHAHTSRRCTGTRLAAVGRAVKIAGGDAMISRRWLSSERNAPNGPACAAAATGARGGPRQGSDSPADGERVSDDDDKEGRLEHGRQEAHPDLRRVAARVRAGVLRLPDGPKAPQGAPHRLCAHKVGRTLLNQDGLREVPRPRPRGPQRRRIACGWRGCGTERADCACSTAACAPAETVLMQPRTGISAGEGAGAGGPRADCGRTVRGDAPGVRRADVSVRCPTDGSNAK